MRIGWIVCAAALAGCPAQGVPNGQCSTGASWSGGGGEEGGAGPTMNPGESCIECHSRGEGPRFTAAGTVMGALDDPDLCLGVEGVTVRLTDANGAVIEMQTNASGNFYTTQAIAMPFTAEIEDAGQVVAMATPQSSGDCASCHTDAGANGAPGRVAAP
jgi:hypothetical protein